MGITVCCLDALAEAAEPRVTSCGPAPLCVAAEGSPFRTAGKSPDTGVSLTFATDKFALAGVDALDDRTLWIVFVPLPVFAGLVLVSAAKGCTI